MEYKRMLTRTKWIAFAASLFFGTTFASAQAKRPTETRNAALRYWMAFAELQDPLADKSTADLLEKTAAGEAAWDEAKLGPILDRNIDAVLIMQRATKLPDCDWGLEYDRGPNAAIDYAPRARVLGRLNTLHGIRMAAKGEMQKAIDSWLAGIRFSQHLAQGGSLIFSLMGKTVLLSNFQALANAVKTNKIPAPERKEIASILKDLPKTGFDWSAALWYEQDALDVSVREMAQAEQPRKYYEQVIGEPPPGIFAVPNASDIVAFHKVVRAAQEALNLPPEQASDRLAALREAVNALHPFYRETMPSFTRINESRAEVLAARNTLLNTLSVK
jgi:hypothetical protein